MLVEVNGDSLRRLIDDDRLHRRPNFTAHRLGNDAVPGEDARLPFGRSAAVTPHRGNNVRNRCEALHVIDHRAGDLPDVRNPATPRRDRDRLSGANRFRQLERRELKVNFARDIGHATSIEFLTNTNHAREGHGLPIYERLERLVRGDNVDAAHRLN